MTRRQRRVGNNRKPGAGKLPLTPIPRRDHSNAPVDILANRRSRRQAIMAQPHSLNEYVPHTLGGAIAWLILILLGAYFFWGYRRKRAQAIEAEQIREMLNL